MYYLCGVLFLMRTHHCPSPPSLSPFSAAPSASSVVNGSFDVVARVLLQTTGGAGGGGGSTVFSKTPGNVSTVRSGTVETGELHSVLEPLRRASRCRFLYSSRETCEGTETRHISDKRAS